MCDDGSTDATYSVAEKYTKQFSDKMILLKNSVNKGLNYTLNKCLKVATGEYVARMDGDDISLPKRLEKEADFLDTHPEYAIVSTPMIFLTKMEIGDVVIRSRNHKKRILLSIVRYFAMRHA